MDAQIWMTGRVGSDVDYKVIDESFAAANFRLACTPRVQRNGEWNDDSTTWVSVRCTRALAEGVRNSLGKGDPVIVIGRLRTRTWIDAEQIQHEQLRIEATTVGHDLTQGTTKFCKLRRSDDSATAASVAGTNKEAAEKEAA